MLWHYRLGNPNFLYLKKLVPTLFNNTNIEVVQCEACQLSKHVRNNYPLQGYKHLILLHPFIVIYGDPLESKTSQELGGLCLLLITILE